MLGNCIVININMRGCVCLSLTGLIGCCTGVTATETSHWPIVMADAAYSERRLRVPEPMVYDLVRPLGVRRGEMEVNALFDINPQTGQIGWAPELELGVADGLAMELELPFDNLQQTRHKVALQKTLEIRPEHGDARGWQVLVDYQKHHRQYAMDATYLHAQRWTDAWSSLSMLGLRLHEVRGQRNMATLINNTLFYDVSDKLTLGLELNHQVSRGGTWRYRATPQLHYDLSPRYTAQLGWGYSNLHGAKKEEMLWSIRLIRVF